MSRGRSMDRPPAAEGWGMLMAKKTRTLTGPDGERIQVTAGTSRVHRSHWAIRLHPEVFEVCDRGDTRTQRDHARALAHIRAELERATGVARPPIWGPGREDRGRLRPLRPRFEARARDRARGGGRYCCKSHALQDRSRPSRRLA